MVDSIDFFFEVFGIIILGSSYSLYLENGLIGRIAVVVGVVFMILSKIEYKKNDRNKRLTK